MRRLLFFFSLCLFASALQLYPPAEARAEMVWHRGEVGDPGSLDPHKATTVIEGNVLSELYEGLVTHDMKGEIRPGVSDSWSASPDGLVYTFQLRSDAKWSNGDKVVAGDFVYAFRRLMAPATGAEYANILYTLKNAEKVNKGQLPVEALGVRALNDDELEITLEQKVPYIIAQLAHLTAKPLHQKSIEAYGSDFVRPEHMVTNGPFMLKEFSPSDRIVLVKNPYHYDAAHIALDKEIIYPLEDRAAALRRFMAGEIDTYSDVPVDQIAFIAKHLGAEFKLAPSLGNYYYAYDTRHAPFNDKRVRQALSMVIDREFLAEKIWGGTMEPGYSFVPPGISSYGAPATVTWKDMNPFDREDEAKRLLSEAGYGPGGKQLSVEIRFNNSENHRATAVAIADMWKVLGVETRLLSTDATSHYAYLREKGPFDVARSGWFADYPDAQNYLFLGESDNPGLNTSSFNNKAFDGLMREAAGAPPEQRSQILHKAEALLLEEQPNLVLLIFKSKNLVSQRVKGWETNPLDEHQGRYISIGP